MADVKKLKTPDPSASPSSDPPPADPDRRVLSSTPAEGVKTAAKTAGDKLGLELGSKVFNLLLEASPADLGLLTILVGCNIMLVAPSLIYRLMKGFVSTVSSSAAEVTPRIRIKGWQKALIISIDALILGVVGFVMMLAVVAFCAQVPTSGVSGAAVSAVGKVEQATSGSGAITAGYEACQTVNGVVNDSIKNYFK